MKAALLAAGEGKRLRPITFDRPKPVIPLAGFSLAEYHLSNLARAGVTEVVVVVGYGEAKVREALGTGERFGPSITYVRQEKQLGTAHALKVCEEYLRSEDLFLLLYSDVYIPPSTIKELAREAEGRGGSVAVASVDRPWEFGVVEYDDEFNLKSIIEKPPKGEEPSNLVIAGAFALRASIFEEIASVQPSPRGELELTDAITALSAKNPVRIVSIGNRWTDAGRPGDLLRASRLLLEDVALGKVPDELVTLLEGEFISSGESLGRTDVRGPAYIGPDVELRANCQVGPYVSIEGSASLGNNSVVRNSILLRGARVGPRAQVEYAVLCSRSSVPDGATLRADSGDFSCVLGPDVSLRDLTPPPETVLWP